MCSCLAIGARAVVAFQFRIRALETLLCKDEQLEELCAVRKRRMSEKKGEDGERGGWGGCEVTAVLQSGGGKALGVSARDRGSWLPFIRGAQRDCEFQERYGAVREISSTRCTRASCTTLCWNLRQSDRDRRGASHHCGGQVTLTCTSTRRWHPEQAPPSENSVLLAKRKPKKKRFKRRVDMEKRIWGGRKTRRVQGGVVDRDVARMCSSWSETKAVMSARGIGRSQRGSRDVCYKGARSGAQVRR